MYTLIFVIIETINFCNYVCIILYNDKSDFLHPGPLVSYRGWLHDCNNLYLQQSSKNKDKENDILMSIKKLKKTDRITMAYNTLS